MKNHLIVVAFIILLTACANNSETEKSQDEAQINNTIEENLTTTEVLIQTTSSYPKILKPTVSSIEFAYQSEGIFCIWTGEKFGFLHEDDKEITPFIYDIAYPFNEGLACVMKDGKYGFIDKDGNEKISFIYDKATSFSEGLAYFEIKNTYGFMNKKGEKVFLLNCDTISSFKEGRAFFSINGKYGYIDCNGKKVIDNIYDDVSYFKNGLAKVRKGIYTGVIDIDGKEIIPTQYDNVQIGEIYIKSIKDNVETYFDFLGNEIYSPDGDIVQISGDYNIVKINNKFGVFDSAGNTILNTIYDEINFVENNSLFIVCQDEKYGIINYKNEIKVPLRYDFISTPFVENGDITYVNICLNDKYGVLSLSDFTENISPAYDSINTFHEGYAIAYLDGKYGLIDESGNYVIPMCEYDYIFSISDSLLGLEKDDRYYLANNNGEKISSKDYDYINQFSKVGNFQIFEKNGKEGLLDSNGNEVVTASYDYISGVYRSNTSFIATNYNDSIKNRIIVVAEYQNIDLSDIILVNEITPKIQPYHNLSKELITNFNFSEILSYSCSIMTVKLFSVDGYEEPILYFHIEPAEHASFPMSDSAFYCISDNQVKELVRGNECGGSLRGDYVQLYFEKETGRVLLGTNGFYGGFGGYSSDYGIYKNNKEYLYMYWISQTSSNFLHDNSFLLENAHLFYDSDGTPLSKENILEVDYMTEHSINDKTVSVEEFNNELDKYVIIPMQLQY